MPQELVISPQMFWTAALINKVTTGLGNRMSPEPTLLYYQLDPWEYSSIKYESNNQNLIYENESESVFWPNVLKQKY